MAKYQFPPLKDEKLFEELICDIFNHVESTDSYRNTDFQLFGVKGQNQKGVDIISSNTRTVIQCKSKDIRKSDDAIRKNLYADMEADLLRISEIDFSFDRLVFVSTFRDDARLQEYAVILKDKGSLPYDIYYWGWDTVAKYIEEFEDIRNKYYPQYKPKRAKSVKPEFPEGALGRNLSKKNYVSYLIKRYGEWKQFELDRKNEKFNWASFNKSIMNRYKASGINYIDIRHFDDLVDYLQKRIDGTIMGKAQKAKGLKNYSTFQEVSDNLPKVSSK